VSDRSSLPSTRSDTVCVGPEHTPGSAGRRSRAGQNRRRRSSALHEFPNSSCQPQSTRTFSPLVAGLPERTTPELLYLESKFAGLVSYGLSAKLLAETLPLGRPLHPIAVRLHAQATAERLEDDLGPEQPMFIEGCQAEWDELPRPDLPLTVGLDGGYVHSSQQRSRRDGWFEVIAGKSMPTDGPAKCFGFVQTYRPQTEASPVRSAQGARDAAEPAGDVSDRRWRRRT